MNIPPAEGYCAVNTLQWLTVYCAVRQVGHPWVYMTIQMKAKSEL